MIKRTFNESTPSEFIELVSADSNRLPVRGRVSVTAVYSEQPSFGAGTNQRVFVFVDSGLHHMELYRSLTDPPFSDQEPLINYSELVEVAPENTLTVTASFINVETGDSLKGILYAHFEPLT